MLKILILIYLLLSLSMNAFSQPTVLAIFTEIAPRLDGKVNEAVWSKAIGINQFFQREPNPGESITERTEMLILYDQHHLYFGIRCYCNPDIIVAKELARDVSLKNDDRIQIILDTFLDHRNGYWFQIGPRGSIGDALVGENGAAFNKEWDGLWEGKAKIHEQGWDAEVAIPFKTLNFNPGQTTWGLKLIRHIITKQESGYWPVANLNTHRFQISDSGLLSGLQNITQGIGLDVSPYGLLGMDQTGGERNKFPVETGVDLFYQLTPGLKSALTIHTDFAQTEVDARQINLTRFQLHFPEKRDFFLDGANYFNFGVEGDRDNPFGTRLIPFFSRRIGLDEAGNPIPILGGAKITGQVGPWNLGILNILDERAGKNQNFFVTRITRNLGRESSIGLISTHGNALSTARSALFGLDLRLATSTFKQDKNLTFILYGLKSHTSGLVRKDHAFGSELIYPNDFLSLRLGYREIGENFRAGVGFVPRLGTREGYFNSLIGPRPDRWGILQVLTGFQMDYLTDFNNTLLTRHIKITPFQFRFKTGDELLFQVNPRFERLTENFEIHPEHLIPRAEYAFTRYLFRVVNSPHRRFWTAIETEWGHFFNGDRREWTVEIGYKVVVPLFVGIQFEHNDVSLADGQFKTEIIRLNANFLFSPNMTLYNYLQYDNLSDKMGWQARFHWILKPGNEIMLVWNSIWQEPLQRWEVSESSTRFKVRYNYRF